MKAYLGIGTNLGDREANLTSAVEHINEQAGHVLACSSFVEYHPLNLCRKFSHLLLCLKMGHQSIF